MTYAIGFLVWLAIGIVAGIVLRIVYHGPTTVVWLTQFFAIAGAFIGGMLGVSPYVAHDPSPLRLGGLIGAVLGAGLFSFLYHLIARKAI
jgi:uncharacterized membrane protein YeaQ/YmgE (transglycosylase-associated protein family)